jgi:hypothetical protein
MIDGNRSREAPLVGQVKGGVMYYGVLTEKERKHIEWIKKNLNTQKKWRKYDYVDFYNRDIKFFLKMLEGK